MCTSATAFTLYSLLFVLVYVFLSTSLWLSLLPLLSSFRVSLRVVSLPDDSFDGRTMVEFEAHAMSAFSLTDMDDDSETHVDTSYTQQSQTKGDSTPSPSNPLETDDDIEEESTVSFEVEFYHCLAGSFWNPNTSATARNTSLDDCKLCTDVVDGETEVTEEQHNHNRFWTKILDAFFVLRGSHICCIALVRLFC